MASSEEPVTFQIEALSKVHNENADREKKDLKRKLADTKKSLEVCSEAYDDASERLSKKSYDLGHMCGLWNEQVSQKTYG